jgi:hypothetical protein
MSDKTSFEDFERDELFALAVEEFGVEVEKDANKKEILAALAEEMVAFQDYLDNHPDLPKPKKAPVVEQTKEEVTEELTEEIITATNPVHNANAKYLVVMDRDNPIYEAYGYRFTKENPYALVTAAAAEKILREPGFRQAFPSELQEFYS